MNGRRPNETATRPSINNLTTVRVRHLLAYFIPPGPSPHGHRIDNLRTRSDHFARRALPLAAAIVAACGGGGEGGVTPPPPTSRQLLIQGRVERGLSIRLLAAGPTDTLPILGSAITVSPNENVVIAGDSVQLLRVGSIHISATVGATTLSADTAVAPPPQIVFDALVQGNRDIYRMSLDGQDLVKLTSSPGEDIHPSATSTQIVFTSFRDGNGELYSIHPDGSGEARLSRTPSASSPTPVNETLPVVSPNGAMIAYLSDATHTSRVWLSTIGFANPTPLTTANSGNATTIESGAAWSPGSDRLVVVSTATPSGHAGLFLVAATPGAAAARLGASGDLGPEVEPSWSAAGASVTYASSRGDTTSIFVRDVSTGAEKQIVHGLRSLGQPAWLGDGRIVFTDFGTSMPSLKWVDPAAPALIHPIATPGLAPQHASALPSP